MPGECQDKESVELLTDLKLSYSVYIRHSGLFLSDVTALMKMKVCCRNMSGENKPVCLT